MIASVGFLIYDVVKGIWGTQKEDEEKKPKVQTMDEIMKRLNQSTLDSILNKKTSLSTLQGASDTHVLGGMQPNSVAPMLKQTFVIMADGKETFKKELQDENVKREFYDNKNIYIS